MNKCGLQRPIDVWFDNLIQVLTTPFTSTDEYVNELYKTMYPADARWVNMHTRCKLPVLCVPQEGSNEFMLSEGASCLHEGSDDGKGKAWTEFHAVCIVAPELAVLMRDDYLPEIVDDRNDNIRLEHAQKLRSQLAAHHNSSETTSMFHDLPVYKPCAAYTKTEADCVSLESSKSSKSPADLLDFPITRLDTAATQDINTLVLNEAYCLSEIVCESKAALNKAIDTFLRRPSEGVYRLKNYTSETDARALHIKRLEKFGRIQGFKVAAVYNPSARRVLKSTEFLQEVASEHTREDENLFTPEKARHFKSNFFKTKIRNGHPPCMAGMLSM